MRYDTVLFDLDGTLTTSFEGIYASIRHALAQLEWPEQPEEGQLRSFVGPPLAHSFAHQMGMEEEQAMLAVQHYRAFFAQTGWAMNSVYPGIPRLLKSLKARGARLYIATAKPQVFAEKILEHFALGCFFDGVQGVSLSDMSADKARIIHQALPENPGRVVMVGDRGSDITGARANGIDSVAVGYGFGEEEELAEARPTEYVSTVEQLTDWLLEGEAPAPGLFLSVEGIDGSGKSTHLPRIAACLEAMGHLVLRTREPGGDPVAEQIRALLLDPRFEDLLPQTEALLYAASRAQHVRRVIRPALLAGQLVLCDRFVDSSLAYQGAGRDLGVAQVWQANEMALDGLLPDLTLLFWLDSQTARRRLALSGLADRIEREPLPFFERVSKAYLSLKQEQPERIRLVDAGGTMEETYAQAEAVVKAGLRAWGGGKEASV